MEHQDMFEDSTFTPSSTGRNRVGKRLFASSGGFGDAGYAGSEVYYKSAAIFLRIDESEASNDSNENKLNVDIGNNTVTLTSSEDDTMEICSFDYIYAEDIGNSVFIEHFTLERMHSFLQEDRHVTLLVFGSPTEYKPSCIYGDSTKPGLIMKSIQIILNSIKGKEMEGFGFKPDKFDRIVTLDDKHIQVLSEFKYELLLSREIDEKSYKNNLEEVCQLPEREEGVGYAIWISFIQITDDGIFQLLWKSERGLKIAEDKEYNKYVKGAQYVLVKNEEEAYKIMMIARENKTKQSHLIFNIKMVKHSTQKEPKYGAVFSFSVVDVDGDSGLTSGFLTARGDYEEGVRNADLTLCKLLERELNGGPERELHLVITASSSDFEETKRIISATNETFSFLPKVGKIRQSHSSSFTMVSLRQSGFDVSTDSEEESSMWESDEEEEYESDYEEEYSDEDEEDEERREEILRELAKVNKARETLETDMKKEFENRMEKLLEENADHWRNKTESEIKEREEFYAKQREKEMKAFETQMDNLREFRVPENVEKLKKVLDEYEAAVDKRERLKESIEEIRRKQEEQKLAFKKDEERLLKKRSEALKEAEDAEKEWLEAVERKKQKEIEEEEKAQKRLIELKTKVFDLRNEIKKSKEECDELDAEIEKLQLGNKENTPKKKKKGRGKRSPKTEPKKKSDKSWLEGPEASKDVPVPSTVQKPLRKKLFKRLDGI